MKEKIITKFDKSKYLECDAIDNGIMDLIKEINNYDNIMTLFSCEGHICEDLDNKEHYSIPYLSFLLNEKGWNIFWLEIVPELVSIYTYKDMSSVLYVNINTSFDDENKNDNAFISLHGNEICKDIFWKRIKETFVKLK